MRPHLAVGLPYILQLSLLVSAAIEAAVPRVDIRSSYLLQLVDQLERLQLERLQLDRVGSTVSV